MKAIKCALLAAVAMAAPCIHAEESSPVMLSLLNPVQWPSSQSDVGGFRLSLVYGQCDDFAGLDVGLVGCATGDFRGLAVGGANIVSRRLVGLQVGLVNWNSNGDESSTRRSIGVQYGLLNYADSLLGLQKADRLYLHAELLSFNNPETGERLTFRYPAPFFDL